MKITLLICLCFAALIAYEDVVKSDTQVVTEDCLKGKLIAEDVCKDKVVMEDCLKDKLIAEEVCKNKVIMIAHEGSERGGGLSC